MSLLHKDRIRNQNPIKNDQESNAFFSKFFFDDCFWGMAIPKIYWETSPAFIWLSRQRSSNSGAKLKKESLVQGVHSINRGFICRRGRGLVERS